MTSRTSEPTRVTLVTGGSGGIGRVVATCIARPDEHVVVAGRPGGTAAQVVVDEIVAAGGSASAAAADLLEPKQIKELVDGVVAEHGRLDHLVASGAGFSAAGLHFKLFTDMDPDDFSGVVNAHWLGKAHLIHAALAHMVPAAYGKIVNISSDAGRVPTPNESMLGGAAAGLMLMTRAVAREVGRQGVRINTISLGPLADVDMVRLAQLSPSGEASVAVAQKLTSKLLFPVTAVDIAAAAQFLLSPAGDNVTGQTISVNGGVSTT
jgi:3-oxoacyl-[acyl-carrier protein] reductase